MQGEAGLHSRVALATPNLERFHEAVAGLLRPYALSARTGPYDARLRHTGVAGIGLTTIRYGNAVEIAADSLERFYLVQFALAGGYRGRSLGGELEIARDRAQLVNPVAPLTMRWDPACRMLVVRFDKAMVGDYLAALSGGRARGAPVFGEAIPLTTPAGARLRRTVASLMRAIEHEPAMLASPLAARQVEQLLFAQVLAAAGHGLPFDKHRWSGVPYYVKRAEDFIAANLANDISLIDIVASSGVSMRTLYYGFRRRHGVGPIAWMKRLRLDRTRADLDAAVPGGTTVTEVATRWGFVHFGRFAADYRARFGMTPLETLRGAR